MSTWIEEEDDVELSGGSLAAVVVPMGVLSACSSSKSYEQGQIPISLMMRSSKGKTVTG